jgi:hypothetical protein
MRHVDALMKSSIGFHFFKKRLISENQSGNPHAWLVFLGDSPGVSVDFFK